MWLTLGLKALGIGKTLLAWGRSALGWIFKDWRHVLIAVLSLFAAYNYIGASKWQSRAERALATVEVRDKTIADMTATSEVAKQAALANAKRVELEYKEIADNAKITYDRTLADNRATVDRWLRQNNRGATGQTDSTAATKIPTGIAGAETLPIVPRGFVLLPATDLPLMADIQATLYALQQAAREVERVHTLPPTP
jgi:hypothetical protein